MKPGTIGRIANTGPLAGVRVKLVKIQRASGTPLVELLEPLGAYAKGDRVQLGAGEFLSDEGPAGLSDLMNAPFRKKR